MNINNSQVRHWLDLVAWELTSEFDSIEDTDEESTDLAYNKYVQAMYCLERGYYDAAEEMFRGSIEIYRTNDIDDDEDYDDYGYPSGMIYAPYLGLSYCYTKTNRPHEAIRVLKKAIAVMTAIYENDYRDSCYMRDAYWDVMLDLYVEIGRVYVSTGNDEMAQYYYETAVDYLHEHSR